MAKSLLYSGMFCSYCESFVYVLAIVIIYERFPTIAVYFTSLHKKWFCSVHVIGWKIIWKTA